MDIHEAEVLALKLMEEHDLPWHGWSFGFDRAVSRFGVTYHRTQRITLSRALVELNSESDVRDTILHEIAHALAGAKAGHGKVWQDTARAIGCNGKRTHDAITPPGKYRAICATCGRESRRHRPPARGKACGRCCREYAGGRYSAEYSLTYVIAVD